MSLFNQGLRPPSRASEEAVARYVASIRVDLDPDPLFTRRLRGTVVNRYVAQREGASGVRRTRREMGRLGRSVLIASVALAMSVGGVMAAAQEALPGDALYPLKRQVERLRHVVLPAHLADDLLAIELAERIDELERVTVLGQTEQASALVAQIGTDYRQLAALDSSATAGLELRLTVLTAIIEQLPDQARAAVEDVIEGVEMREADGHPGGGNLGGSNNDGTNPNGSTNNGGANNDGSSGNAPSHASSKGGVNPPQSGSGKQPPPSHRPLHAGRPSPSTSPTPSPAPSPEGG